MTGKMVHLRIPEDLFERLQNLRSEFGFQTNQEYIRAAIRKMNEELEKKKIIEYLEKHKGSIERIERMDDLQREKFFQEFLREESSEIFRKYGLD
jgi:Arc/MetJ-type ribon-helix-helix transcriptional regulator